MIREVAEPIADMGDVDLDPLLERVGQAKVVLLGEATHGTSEFYQMRARITRELITKRGFTIVAAEADWPDAARVNRYVRHGAPGLERERAFTRFPTTTVSIKLGLSWGTRSASAYAQPRERPCPAVSRVC
jgi:protein-L-isoaspartate(D-aspartate) O-methyltransferase